MADCLYPDVTLIIFAKAPIPGFCKTRLIPLLGETGTAKLQQELTENCIHKLCSKPLCNTQLWCAPDTSHKCFQSLAKRYSLSLHTQVGVDLGDRMFHAMSNQATPYTIIVGTDVPMLTEGYLVQAIQVLQKGIDAVLGPAEDGGYVLFGLKEVSTQLFQGIAWGTRAVFAQTVEKLDAAALTWRAIEPLWDVDDEIDLRRFKALKMSGQN